MQETGIHRQQKTAIIVFSIVAVIFIAAVITGIVFLSRTSAETTGRVRDIFIIVLALESLLIGAALIILVIQIAVLTNLVQNEVRPILANTKETVSTLRGTSEFISKRAVAPIISVSSTLAGFGKLLEIIGFIRKK
jgi:NADH:ubiquinone oxidoreductase subunit K